MRRCTLFLVTTLVILAQAGPVSARHGDCGQPASDGGYPLSTDALYVLRAAVDLKDCGLEVCDVDSDCGITVRDALLTLGNAVTGDGLLGCDAGCATPFACGDSRASSCGGSCPTGQACVDEGGLRFVAGTRHDHDDDSDDRGEDRDGDSDGSDRGERGHDRDGDSDRQGRGDRDGDSDSDGGPGDPERYPGCVCVPDGVPKTDPPVDPSTTTSTTSTTTVTVTVPSTPTTSLTTTTTMGADANKGMSIYDAECGTCHRAGSHDQNGFAPNLSGKGGKLRRDVSSITGAHPGNLQFSQQEIDDLEAFLNGL